MRLYYNRSLQRQMHINKHLITNVSSSMKYIQTSFFLTKRFNSTTSVVNKAIKAEKAFTSGNFKSALQLYTELCYKEENNIGMNSVYAGVAASKLGIWSVAETHLHIGIQHLMKSFSLKKKQILEARCWLVRSLLELNQVDKAIEEMKIVDELTPRVLTKIPLEVWILKSDIAIALLNQQDIFDSFANIIALENKSNENLDIKDPLSKALLELDLEKEAKYFIGHSSTIIKLTSAIIQYDSNLHRLTAEESSTINKNNSEIVDKKINMDELTKKTNMIKETQQFSDLVQYLSLSLLLLLNQEYDFELISVLLINLLQRLSIENSEYYKIILKAADKFCQTTSNIPNELTLSVRAQMPLATLSTVNLEIPKSNYNIKHFMEVVESLKEQPAESSFASTFYHFDHAGHTGDGPRGRFEKYLH